MALGRLSVVLVASLTLLSGCSPSRAVKAMIEAVEGPGDSPPPVKASKDRKTAPEFELKDIDGHALRLSDFRGKVVLLDFWATWCGPCRIEIPWFKDFERQNKDKGFAVIGVAMDDDGWEAVKPYAQEMGINYRLVIGDDKIAAQYGGVDSLPTTFLIDRDGKIAAVHVGLAGKRDFENGIQALLEGSGTPSVPAVFVRAK